LWTNISHLCGHHLNLNLGNLLFRIDLPNDDTTTAMVKNALAALDQIFSDDTVEVDKGTFNASRIWKVYGSVAGKGDNTEARPHRVAGLLHVPEHIDVVPIEKLQALADQFVEEPASRTRPGNGQSANGNGTFDLAEWITCRGLKVTGPTAWQGGQRWVFETCPWNPEHTNRSAFIIQQPTGAIGAGCHHNGCQGKGWRELRDVVEPDWRIRRNHRDTCDGSDRTPRNAEKTGVVSRVTEAPPWKPFPVGALPEPIGGFIRAGAKSIGCDPSFLALPLLAALASAIGATKRIELKPGWTEPAVVWTAIVGESGTMKSPAMALALGPLKRLQAYAMAEYPELQAQYVCDCALFDADMASWKHKGRATGEPPPEKPEEPQVRRYLIDDVTIEALADRLQHAPRGLLCATDELAGWLASFGQYKSGGRNGDVSRWLSIHRAESLLIDRKTGATKTIYIPRAAVSVCGGIQPEILRRSLGAEHLANGLAARLLVTMPPRMTKVWTNASVDGTLQQDVDHVFDRLLALDFQTDDDGQPAPLDLKLNPAGKSAWIRFYNRHAKEQAELTGELAAAWSKLEGYAGRLALIVHLCRFAADDPSLDPDHIDAQSIEAGVTLVEWFGNEARRVYRTFDENEEDRDCRQLIELIERQGGQISTRELQRCRHLATSEDAEKVLARLADADLGEWITVQTGGRPASVFRLSSSVTRDTTPLKPEENDASVTSVTGESFDDINRLLGAAGDLDTAQTEE